MATMVSAIHISNCFHKKQLLEPTVKTKSRKISKLNCKVCASGTHRFDVVVVGAGIIGLSIARDLLHRTNLSVAVVDAKVPCSGATGAGSLLIGRTEAELDQLKRRIQLLSAAGIRAEFLHSNDLATKEPKLEVGQESGAAFLPDDCQLDAYRTVAYIEKGNHLFESQGRYAEFYNDPAVSFLRSEGKGNIEGIKTKQHTLYGEKAIIIAAGCWSGSLMDDLLKDSDIVLHVPVKPRKGHLLVLENFNPLGLCHGLMEVGYVDRQHSISSSREVDDQALSISMVASSDASGNLLIGSSRQFAGFNTDLDASIVACIWERAQLYFPALREFSLKNLSEELNVRIGLRPFMPDSKPVIGPVPGIPNLFLATGHEGSGLSMALGTAELITDMVLGNSSKVDSTPFAVEGRCC